MLPGTNKIELALGFTAEINPPPAAVEPVKLRRKMRVSIWLVTIRVFLTWPQYFFIWEGMGGAGWRAGKGLGGIICVLVLSMGALPNPTPPNLGHPRVGGAPVGPH